jgi:hypothetical protein
LPYSSNSFLNGTGQIVQITKVDTTTGTVTVIAHTGNTIAGSTTTVVLNAVGQTAELIADGTSAWWPTGHGIETTPAYLGFGADGGSSITYASSTTVICPFTATVPTSITGYSWYVISGPGGKGVFGVYDKNGNVVTSTGPITVGTFGGGTVATTPTNIPPGQYYWAAQMNLANIALSSVNSNGGNGSFICSSNAGTTMGLPNPFVFGTGAAQGGHAISVKVAGGRTGV